MPPEGSFSVKAKQITVFMYRVKTLGIVSVRNFGRVITNKAEQHVEGEKQSLWINLAY